MIYLEVALIVPSYAAEPVAWALIDRGVPGVVVEERRPDEPPSPTTAVKVYLPQAVGAISVDDLKSTVAEALGHGASFEVGTREIPEEDWATSWQQYWHVQRIGERLVVRPSWESYDPGPADVVLVLDPKQAFGTGTHATTRLCMRALERLASEGSLGEVFDVGAGSGILAVAALLLGAPRAVAVDTDPVAVASAKENAELNGVGDRLISLLGSTERLEGGAPVVVANILAEVIIDLAAELYLHTSPGGTLIASGILQRKEADVGRALELAGFRVESCEHEAEWSGLRATRPAS